MKVHYYEKLKQVGKGAYAKVFQVKDKVGKVFALKKIEINVLKTGLPISVAREVKLLQALCHKNVVRLEKVYFEKSLDKQHFYNCNLILEYCSHDLAGLFLAPEKSFAFEHFLFIFKEALAAVAYLHSKRIWHRDIKPSNILLTSEGQVKLADFGLSRIADPALKSYSGNVVTVIYRAPEILKGESEYTEKIDIWALGCIFGEFFFKKPLFKSESEIGVLAKIDSFQKEKPGLEGMDEEQKDLFWKLVCKDPRERLSAQEALEHPLMNRNTEIYRPEKETHEFEARKTLLL